MKTYRTFEKYGILRSQKILGAGWDELVRVLDEGGYVRYDFSTATKLLNRLTRIEDALIKLYLRYGKKGKCRDNMPPDIMALMKT